MTKLLSAAFLFMATISHSQIRGTVQDRDNNPLPYVNIFLKDTYKGTTSNDNGVYEINISETGHYELVFQFLGYKTQSKKLTIEKFPYNLDIVLEEENISLKEVVVNTQYNPANQIIRSAIGKRKAYLDKRNTFTADFYSKGVIRIKDAPENFIGVDIGDFEGALDSTRTGIIYLSETLSKISYNKPDIFETIVASKVSGNSNGISFNSAMDVDFNLYNNTVNINNDIISPIADYAFNYYKYKLEGEFYDSEGHLIYKIKLLPKRENDRVFTGSIYIVDESWALYGVDISVRGSQIQILPADTIRIRQNLTFDKNDNQWLIRAQTIDFGYSVFGFKGDGSFVANYTNYDLNPTPIDSKNNNEILVFEKDATKKESNYWNDKRPVPLTSEESNDYLRRDSIERVRNSKVYLDSIDRENNKFSIVNLLVGKTYKDSYNKKSLSISGPIEGIQFNTVQGYNVSINGNFTKQLNDFKKYYSIVGTVNYSTESQRLRATVGGRYRSNAINNTTVWTNLGVKTEQFNADNPISASHNSISSLFFESNYMKIYNREFIEVGYSRELFNGLKVSTKLGYENRKALYNNSDRVITPRSNIRYTSNNPLSPNNFNTAPFLNHNMIRFNIDVGIRFGEKYMTYPDFKFNVSNSDFPRLNFKYVKGFNANIANYNFDHLSANLQQNINLKTTGVFKYNLTGGTFFGNPNLSFIDYKHFNGNLTHLNTKGNYLSSFKNMAYYNYSTSNNYFEFHVEHDFKGYILGKIPLLKTLNFNLILGAHGVSSTDQNPYKEFNIGVGNLGWKKYRFLRVDYVQSYFGGQRDSALMFGISL